jgi:hypothetical protein
MDNLQINKTEKRKKNKIYNIPILNALVWDAGNSSVITIPSDYIKNGQIISGKTYNVILEVQENE